MGKYGLTGNSGWVGPDLHIASTYDSNGGVFVEVDNKDFGLSWERVSMEEARRNNMSIIKCSMCDKPAVSLDHYWPYDSTCNRCAEHHNAKNKGE